MRIRKVTQSPLPTEEASIVDGYSTSTTNGYSCNYVNSLYSGVELYNNSTGTNGSVSLSENTSNFTYLEIFYRSNDWDYNSVKIYSPYDKNVSLSVIHPTSTGATQNYWKTKIIHIGGTSITNTYYSEIAIYNGGNPSISGSNNIYITRVIGYK